MTLTKGQKLEEIDLSITLLNEILELKIIPMLLLHQKQLQQLASNVSGIAQLHSSDISQSLEQESSPVTLHLTLPHLTTKVTISDRPKQPEILELPEICSRAANPQPQGTAIIEKNFTIPQLLTRIELQGD